jgi:hypothetical protein
MEFIAHRINTIRELKKVPKEYGVEVDLRDYGDRLILHHDPFKEGEDFEEYLKHYDHGTIILNIKSERIEFRVIDLLIKYKITDYFFLDCSFPMIHLLSEQGEKNIALRFSEFEGLDTIRNMKGKVNWIWVDYLLGYPLRNEFFNALHELNMKVCLVCPSLLRKDKKIIYYKQRLEIDGFMPNAICLKLKSMPYWMS